MWKYFKVHGSSHYSGITVCQLRAANDHPQSAEIKYSEGSPTNLMSHLDTSRVGRRAAHNEILTRLSKWVTRGKGAESTAAAGAIIG